MRSTGKRERKKVGPRAPFTQQPQPGRYHSWPCFRRGRGDEGEGEGEGVEKGWRGREGTSKAAYGKLTRVPNVIVGDGLKVLTSPARVNGPTRRLGFYFLCFHQRPAYPGQRKQLPQDNQRRCRALARVTGCIFPANIQAKCSSLWPFSRLWPVLDWFCHFFFCLPLLLLLLLFLLLHTHARVHARSHSTARLRPTRVVAACLSSVRSGSWRLPSGRDLPCAAPRLNAQLCVSL